MTIDGVVKASEDSRTFRLPRGFLNRRAALVTGGARRIGRILALALASEGSRVVVHYHHSRQEAEETAAIIADQGGECHLVQGDLANAMTAARLVLLASEAAEAPIDILVNNAAVFGGEEAITTEQEDWDRYQAVNLRAPFLLAREMARQLPVHMRGDVVNINDVAALKPGPDHFPYIISKVGLHGLTQSLALALAPSIRVNELMLGAILPPENGQEDYVHVPVGGIPTQRFDSPVEVGSALLFLLGNPALTGQSLCVDGGRHLL